MDCSVLKRLMNRDENAGGTGGSGSHGALGLLSGGKCLLLDCRPFLAHSAGYIRGSVNVRCNTIVRRRAKGSVSLEQILPAEEEVRARLRSGLYSAVIVYDERSPRAESLREDSTVSLVVQALRRNAERTDICLLKGKCGLPGATWRGGVARLGGLLLSGPGKKFPEGLDSWRRGSPRIPLRVVVHRFARILCVCMQVRAPEVFRAARARFLRHLQFLTLLALLYLFTLINRLASLAKRFFGVNHFPFEGSAPKCHSAGGGQVRLVGLARWGPALSPTPRTREVGKRVKASERRFD